jgi:hypothetical protein
MPVIKQGASAEAVFDSVNETIDSMTRKPLYNENCRGVLGEVTVEQRHINHIFINLRKRDF